MPILNDFSRIKAIVAGIQLPIGLTLLLVSCSHCFPLGINLLELLGAFAHLTLMLAATLVIISALFRLPILGGLSLVSAVICGVLIGPHFTTTLKTDRADFTIGQFNLYHHNPRLEEATLELVKQNLDVFTIQEQNAAWSQIIDSTFEVSHPYTVESPWEECCYGIGLYSKYPITSYEVVDVENTPLIIAHILVGKETLTVVSLHTRPPAFPNETEARNHQLAAVAEIVSHEKGTCLVIGDFNIVPWDATFKNFLKAGNLTPVRDGFQATYPMDLGIPFIPIDYITYSDGLLPAACETFVIPGSDHKGIVASFKFKE